MSEKQYLISQETLKMTLSAIGAACYPNVPANQIVNVVDRLRSLPEHIEIAPSKGDTPDTMELSPTLPGSELAA